jgi:hypothetical protein
MKFQYVQAIMNSWTYFILEFKYHYVVVKMMNGMSINQTSRGFNKYHI